MIKISNLKNKGFMLAEVIITSSVIAVTLVTLYITLNKVSSLYETNARYNDIDAEQVAIELNKSVSFTSGPINNSIIDTIKNNFGYTAINAYRIDNNFNQFSSISISNNFKDYIDYLKNNINLSDYEYIVIVEIQKKDVNDCYYYALKVEIK